jgi:hypothetical protein
VSAPRTKAELENQLASYSRENENLRKQLAALQAAQLPPELFIALKAVDHHGYHETTVVRWCERGLIDSKREGSRWFVKQSSVDAWIRRLQGG